MMISFKFFKTNQVKTRIVLCLLVFFAICQPALAEITETHDLAVIAKHVSQAKKDALVIFDIDDVLITGRDQIFHPLYSEYKFNKFQQIIAKGIKKENYINLRSICLMSPNSEGLLDERILTLLNSLQEKNIKTIALTMLGTGKYGKIENLEDFRIDRLTSFGINFKELSKIEQDISFPEIKAKQGVPLLKNGIIFTAGAQKGIVLKRVLEKIKIKPKTIIFIDDRRENIESVDQYCKTAGINFTGFEYKAAIHKPIQPLNKKRVNLQLDLLQNKHIWLNDKEADEKLKILAH